VKARTLFIANLLLGLGILALVLVRYGGPALEILGAGISVPFLVAFSLAVTATLTSLAWRWGWVLEGVTAPPRLVRLSLYRSAAHTLAVLIPSGKLSGDPLRAWLLTRDGVPVGPAISGVAVDRALELASNSPFSVIFALVLLQPEVPELKGAVVVLGSAMLGLFAGCAIATRRLRHGSGLVAPLIRAMRLDRLKAVNQKMDVLAEADAAAAEIIGNPRRMITALVAGLFTNLLVLVEFAMLLAAFGLPTDPIAVVAAVFATGAAHLLPVPAGIGVLEGANLWLFQLLGYPPDVGLAVGLAARLRELIWMLPGVTTLLTGSIRMTLSRMREA
jgi:uncharacterized protein (TIRG00374 family)